MTFLKFRGRRFAAMAAVLLLCAASTPAFAQRAGDQGFGLMLGNPSGFSAKVWLDDTWAIDGAVGADRGEWDIHMSFLRHDFRWQERLNIAPPTGGELPLYYGIGPRVLFADDDEFGVRFPIGLSFLPHAQPWEFFFEVAPVMRFTPDFGFNGDIAIGARYYFSAVRPRK